MRNGPRPALIAVVGCVWLGFLLASVCNAAPDLVKQEMTAAVAAVRPALVRIHVVAADYEQGREVKRESFGSGVIISAEGHVVTNAHVAMQAEHIVCTLADKREVDAKAIGTDPLSDIAVIKLAGDGKHFPFASFGDSSVLSVGDRVFAMGCPLALSQSVTAGVVSNVEMMMPSYMSGDALQLEGEDVGSLVRWIGHDALIRPGNSGGPLVTPDGKIVGINEISFGLSGAIPSNLAKGVVEQLIKHGKVQRSWLGIEVQPLLESSDLKQGIVVGGVFADSPAARAGLQSGDVILALAGKPVTAQFREEVPIFNQYVASLPVGKPAEVRVLRAGTEITLTVTTSERPKARERQHELKPWGICGTNITYLMQKEMRLPSQNGVVVTSVLPSGPAGSAKPEIRSDDVIVRVGDKEITDLGQLRTVTKEFSEGKTAPVPTLVEVLRNQERFATVLKLGKKEPARPSSEISKAWLPLGTQVITPDLAAALGVAGTTGVRVTQVYPGGSAEAAGIRVGDLIVKLDGEAIPADQIGDDEVLASMVRQYDVGADVKLGVIRKGEPMEVAVRLDASPKPTRDYPKFEEEHFEFTARDIAFADRVAGAVAADVGGALVEGVVDGSWASLAGLRAGDVITEVGSAQVHNLDDLRRVMSDVTSKRPKAVVLRVRRGIRTLFVEIEPVWTETR